MVEGRRRGLSFEEWWLEAVCPPGRLVLTTSEEPPATAVRWPSDGNDRVAWRAAIMETREGWRRAFEREARTPGDLALLFLMDAIDSARRVGVGLELVVAA
jgi:hypothetical protein